MRSQALVAIILFQQAEKEVLYEDMENMYLRLYSVGKKIRQMNKKVMNEYNTKQ